MESSSSDALLFLGLLTGLAILIAVAPTLRIPYPILRDARSRVGCPPRSRFRSRATRGRRSRAGI